MENYFSDRNGQPRPKTIETIDQPTWAGLLSLINSRIADGSFGHGFPAICQEDPQVVGTDDRSLWDRALGLFPRLREPPRCDGVSESLHSWQPDHTEPPPTDAILDLMEMLARNIGKPIQGKLHSFYSHHHLTFDVEAGKQQWIADVNGIFARAGLVYEMTPEGRIERLLSLPLHDIIAATEFITGDADTDGLLARATGLISSGDVDAHQDALEKLWDAFERIKTLAPGEKKQSSEALLRAAEVANAPKFNKQIEAEFELLTKLGNQHRIRHSETAQEHIPSRREAEYLFHRMYALIRYVLQQTSRLRQK